jgi:hypothetical protein
MVVVDTELGTIIADQAWAGCLKKHGELDSGVLLCDLGDLSKWRNTCDSNIGTIFAFGWVEGWFSLRRHLFGEEI